MLQAEHRIGIGMFGNVENTTVSVSRPVCTSASNTGQRIIMWDIVCGTVDEAAPPRCAVVA
jgi:hypothetical protein